MALTCQTDQSGGQGLGIQGPGIQGLGIQGLGIHGVGLAPAQLFRRCAAERYLGGPGMEPAVVSRIR